MVSLVWGCELKGRNETVNRCVWKVSLVWGCELKAKIIIYDEFIPEGQPRMRLWIESPQRVTIVQSVDGQPRMRLWIERTPCRFSQKHPVWSASYEAVNWKCLYNYYRLNLQQVSLVWGCELKDKGWFLLETQSLVSLVWGCELKDISCFDVKRGV